MTCLFIVYFLVTTFAIAARVMCSIFVHTLSRFVLVSLYLVAEMAHEFSLVSSIIMFTIGHSL